MATSARFFFLVLLASATVSTFAQQQQTLPPVPAANQASTLTPAASARLPEATPSRSSNPVLPEPAQVPHVAEVGPDVKDPPAKLSEKQQRKQERDAEKAAKEKRRDTTYLKLQGDEIVAPTLDADGNTVQLASCARRDKECQRKRKALLHRKKVGMMIANGTLTVDGWTGKARLNYDISEIKFLYVSIPGQGTVIASLEQFPDSQPQKGALDGKTLTMKTPGDHTVQITSDENLVDKKDHVMYVAVDAGFTQPGQFPTIGYGSTAKAPYNWPGVRPLRESEAKISAKAPPLPSGMQITQMKLPCQKLVTGEKAKPVKINGILMTPEVCPIASAKVPAPPAAVNTAGTVALPRPSETGNVQ